MCGVKRQSTINEKSTYRYGFERAIAGILNCCWRERWWRSRHDGIDAVRSIEEMKGGYLKNDWKRRRVVLSRKNEKSVGDGEKFWVFSRRFYLSSRLLREVFKFSPVGENLIKPRAYIDELYGYNTIFRTPLYLTFRVNSRFMTNFKNQGSNTKGNLNGREETENGRN